MKALLLSLIAKIKARYMSPDNSTLKMAADLLLASTGLAWLTVPGHIPADLVAYVPVKLLAAVPMLIGVITVVSAQLTKDQTWAKVSWILLGVALIDAASKVSGDWPGLQSILGGIAAALRWLVTLTRKTPEEAEKPPKLPKKSPELSGETPCQKPPTGWVCSREAGHDGPCAARPVSDVQPPAETVP